MFSTFKYLLPTTSGRVRDAVILGTEDRREVLDFDRFVLGVFFFLAGGFEAAEDLVRLFLFDPEAGGFL